MITSKRLVFIFTAHPITICTRIDRTTGTRPSGRTILKIAIRNKVPSRDTPLSLRLMNVEIVPLEDDDLAVEVKVYRPPVGVSSQRYVILKTRGSAQRGGEFVGEGDKCLVLIVVREKDTQAGDT